MPHQRWDLDWCYSADAVLGKSYARFAAFTEVGGLGAQLAYCLRWHACISLVSVVTRCQLAASSPEPTRYLLLPAGSGPV